jgi:hypothetical protein
MLGADATVLELRCLMEKRPIFSRYPLRLVRCLRRNGLLDWDMGHGLISARRDSCRAVEICMITDAWAWLIPRLGIK